MDKTKDVQDLSSEEVKIELFDKISKLNEICGYLVTGVDVSHLPSVIEALKTILRLYREDFAIAFQYTSSGIVAAYVLSLKPYSADWLTWWGEFSRDENNPELDALLRLTLAVLRDDYELNSKTIKLD